MIRYVRLKAMPAAAARRSLKALVGLALTSIPTSELVPEALDAALRYPITGYDACYVVLAGRLGIPLVTADETLLNAMSGSGYDLRLLSSLGFAA